MWTCSAFTCATFFVVNDDKGQEYFFRYYDPRVLRAFLSVCRAEEINAFFGPVVCYLVEAEEPEMVLKYTNDGRQAERTALSLSAGPQ